MFVHSRHIGLGSVQHTRHFFIFIAWGKKCVKNILSQSSRCHDDNEWHHQTTQVAPSQYFKTCNFWPNYHWHAILRRILTMNELSRLWCEKPMELGIPNTRPTFVLSSEHWELNSETRHWSEVCTSPQHQSEQCSVRLYSETFTACEMLFRFAFFN